MTVSMVHPTTDTNGLLTGAQFADAFSIATNRPGLTAREAAELMFSHSPRWVTLLLKLRDLVITPLGLKTTVTARGSVVDKVGFFPVMSETPQRLLAGLNDNHLDFRVVIDVASDGDGQRVTATTIVLMHNWLGRIYLTLIKPFHRLVVRAMLKQIHKP